LQNPQFLMGCCQGCNLFSPSDEEKRKRAVNTEKLPLVENKNQPKQSNINVNNDNINNSTNNETQKTILLLDNNIQFNATNDKNNTNTNTVQSLNVVSGVNAIDINNNIKITPYPTSFPINNNLNNNSAVMITPLPPYPTIGTPMMPMFQPMTITSPATGLNQNTAIINNTNAIANNNNDIMINNNTKNVTSPPKIPHRHSSLLRIKSANEWQENELKEYEQALSTQLTLLQEQKRLEAKEKQGILTSTEQNDLALIRIRLQAMALQQR